MKNYLKNVVVVVVVFVAHSWLVGSRFSKDTRAAVAQNSDQIFLPHLLFLLPPTTTTTSVRRVVWPNDVSPNDAISMEGGDIDQWIHLHLPIILDLLRLWV